MPSPRAIESYELPAGCRSSTPLNLAGRPARPNIPLNLTLGVLLGCVLGLGVAAVVYWVSNRRVLST